MISGTFMFLSALLEKPLDYDVKISGLSLNSKTIKESEVFCACLGNITHGICYAEQALENGACAVLWESHADYQDKAKALKAAFSQPIIAIDNLSQQLSELAARFYQYPSKDLTIIAVTGTNGKTSITKWLGDILKPSQIIGTLGTTGYTTPDAIVMQSLLASFAKNSYIALEASSHGLEQGRLNAVKTDIAIFTNLSHDHLDYHKNIENYGKAKQKLFYLPGVKTAIINIDDTYGQYLLTQLPNNIKKITYSLYLNEANIYTSKIHLDDKGLSFTIHVDAYQIPIQTKVWGRFNISNLLAVFAVLYHLNINLDEIAEHIANLSTVAGRMEVLSEKPHIIVDYAHTPDALENVLKALQEHLQGKLWCVFGCGGDRDKEKRPLMGSIAEQYADYVIVTNDNPRTEDPAEIIKDILQGIENKQKIQVIYTRDLAISKAIQSAQAEDIILVAGKGHETYQEINHIKHYFSDRDFILQKVMS